MCRELLSEEQRREDYNEDGKQLIPGGDIFESGPEHGCEETSENGDNPMRQ